MKRISIRLCALLLVLALSLSLLSACSLDGIFSFIENVNGSLGGDGSGEEGGDGTGEESGQPTTPPDLSGDDLYNKAYYQTLTDEEKLLYVKIEEGFAALNTSVAVGVASNQDVVFRAFSAVLRDNPEFFWMNGGATLSGQTLFTTSYTLNPYLLDTGKTLAQMQAELQAAVSAIVAEAKAKDTLYEQILFVHDYLVLNCEYDSESVDEILSAAGKTVHTSSTAYGCLVKGKAVCSGYAAAFSIILQELGVPCIRVRGNKIGGEAHEWNAVYFEEASYYVDVTWDDPVILDGDDTLSHAYFFIDEATLTKTHAFRVNTDPTSLDEKIPTCNATAYEYYRYMGYYMESYSRFSFSPIAEKQKDEAVLTVKFGSLSALRAAKQDLVDNSRLRSIPCLVSRLNGKSFSYVVNENALILTFYLP